LPRLDRDGLLAERTADLQENQMTNTPKPNRTKSIVLLVMAVTILTFSMLGFVAKFIEFIHVFRGEADGAFAITPILN